MYYIYFIMTNNTSIQYGAYVPITMPATAPVMQEEEENNTNFMDVNINTKNLFAKINGIINIEKRFNDDESKAFMYELVFVILFGIVPMVIGTLDPVLCDHIDIIGLSINTYLYGLGIVVLICHGSILVAPCFPCLPCCPGSTDDKFPILLKLFHIIFIIFKYIWFVLGGIVLFRSNMECIHEKNSRAIYCLCLWCMWGLETLYYVGFHFLGGINFHVTN